MMATLATALGLEAYAPALWMPLACMALLCAMLIGAVVFDGFDLGVGCLCACAPAHLRARMLALLNPWRDANEYWLLLGLGLFLTAFPHAVRPVLGSLTLPLTLLALGTLLRSVSFECHLRAPATSRHAWQARLALGAWMVAISHGLLLAAFVIPFDTVSNRGWFSAFVALGVTAAYCLSGATWLVMREGGLLRQHATRWARRAVRWAVAGAIGVCAVLGLTNPAVLLRWGGDLSWPVVTTLWLGMLMCVVTIEVTLKRRRGDRASALPFVLTLLMFLAVLGGLFYSVFPDFVLDAVTLWHGAASVATLRLVLSIFLVVLLVMAGFNLWVYRGMFGLSRPPQPPTYSEAGNRR